MLAAKLLSAMGEEEKLYVDDVFQVYTRTGTGASATVTTGINLSAKGGMIWSKGRSGTTDHAIYDTSRGTTFDLASNLTSAQTTQAQGLTAFGATGHTWGTLAKVNTNAATYVDYVFAKAPKFFDVVTWTGDSVFGRTIPHSLGVLPGMVMVKCTTITSNWVTAVRDSDTNTRTGTGWNTTDALGGTTSNALYYTPTSFKPENLNGNDAGKAYVAYLFAHDSSADGIVQCGSFTSDVSGKATVSLGWEPQFILYKSSLTTSSWSIADSSRGLTSAVAQGPLLYANNNSAETANATQVAINATGFTYDSAPSVTHIYLAIRRPNKPPTVGTQVYNAIARTGTSAAVTVTGVGFAPDLVIVQGRNVGTRPQWSDKLRDPANVLISAESSSEINRGTTDVISFTPDGVLIGASPGGYTNLSGWTYINQFFKRAPDVFDVVCYTGANGVETIVFHNLGVVPELIIWKKRNVTMAWYVNSSYFAGGYLYGGSNAKYLTLNSNEPVYQGGFFGASPPSATSIVLHSGGVHNATGDSYVAYLFATKAGISKVGSYTGSGFGQTINCGFTTGARFILIKRTDSTGDWYVYDSTRTYPAGNDPHLSLNFGEIEVTTTDDVDYTASGFIVNQNSTTNLNVTSATYIFLSFA